jgi:hypothetical protein
MQMAMLCQLNAALRIRIRDPLLFDPCIGIGLSGYLIPRDPGSSTHISDSLVKNFWVKNTVSLCQWDQIFFGPVQI